MSFNYINNDLMRVTELRTGVGACAVGGVNEANKGCCITGLMSVITQWDPQQHQHSASVGPLAFTLSHSHDLIPLTPSRHGR